MQKNTGRTNVGPDGARVRRHFDRLRVGLVRLQFKVATAGAWERRKPHSADVG